MRLTRSTVSKVENNMSEFLKRIVSAILVSILMTASSYSAASVVEGSGFEGCEFASEQSETSDEEIEEDDEDEEDDEEPDCD